MFWAHTVEMEAPRAMAGMKAKPLNLDTTPTAAEAFSWPMMLVSTVMIRKDRLVTPFCTAEGRPRQEDMGR